MIKSVIVNYPDDMEELEDKLYDNLVKILINKLQPKEIEEFEKLLKDDNFTIKL